MNKILVLFAVAILAVAGWFTYRQFGIPKQEIPQKELETNTIQEAFSASLQALLEKKLGMLQQFAAQPSFVQTVDAANAKNAALRLEDIKSLDTQWQAGNKNIPIIQELLTNEITNLLVQFQETHPEFVELFVTDSRGANIGMTNKTSDYYQADEQWWSDAFSEGKGKAYFGQIEYDESAQSESIALYVPVYASTNTLVGIIKGVLSITTIRREL